MVLAHVDELSGLLHGAEGSLDDHVGFAHEGHHRAVGCLARIDVEQFGSLDGLNFVGNLFDNVQVASLTEIGHALYNLLYMTHFLCSIILGYV